MRLQEWSDEFDFVDDVTPAPLEVAAADPNLSH